MHTKTVYFYYFNQDYMIQPCVDDIFRLLFNQGTPVSEKDILALTGKKYRYDKFKLKALLKSNSRFREVEEEKWETMSMEELFDDKPIEDVDFIITDLETTGPAQGKDKIIDIAAVKFRNGEVIDSFESLVNPKKTVPSVIVNLTGIKQGMVDDAPEVEEVLPEFIQFLGDGVFTAHNSEFDYSFINCELIRLGLTPMDQNPELCTLNIAKKLLPDVHACGLNGLAKHFNYSIDGRHRAMADVLATQHFLDLFLKMLSEMGVCSFYELLEYQRNPLSRKDLKKQVRRKTRRHLKQFKHSPT